MSQYRTDKRKEKEKNQIYELSEASDFLKDISIFLMTITSFKATYLIPTTLIPIYKGNKIIKIIQQTNSLRSKVLLLLFCFATITALNAIIKFDTDNISRIKTLFFSQFVLFIVALIDFVILIS